MIEVRGGADALEIATDQQQIDLRAGDGLVDEVELAVTAALDRDTQLTGHAGNPT